MTPYELAAKAHAAHPGPRSFTEDVEAHLMNGFVFSTPDFFIMGRAVIASADARLILNPSHPFPRDRADCWFVYLMAGDIPKAWSILPWELPWFCWERSSELRFYRADTIKRVSLPAT